MINPDENNKDEEPKINKPKRWGTILIILGISGLAFSVYTLVHGLGMLPFYGRVADGMLAALVSFFLIIYGYKVFSRDY
jgi:hypothetical protein